jgi:hypothetical protein
MTDATPRAFGADRLETGPGDELVLLCPLSKGWTARTARTTVRAAHPGTAVGWADRVSEVRAAEPQPDGSTRYRLAPWEDGQAFRRFERYDVESEKARAGERREIADAIGKRRLSILFAPLLGLLPGKVQKDMELRFGAPALAMTIVSALPPFVIGFLGMFAHMLGMAGGFLGWPAWLAPPLPIALYLFGESALRLGSAIAGLEPMGSLPVVVAHAAWREARGEGPAEKLESAATDADREQALHDRFSLLEPLLSLLPADSQRALQTRFGFDAIRWGRITAWVLLAVGAPNALAALVMLAAGRGGIGDFLGLVIGAFLAVEQVKRLGHLGRGEPSGSVLGALVRPMAGPLLAQPASTA